MKEVRSLNNTKFTMNSLIIVVIIFTAIGLFFTIKLVNMADRLPINEYYPIEDTDLAIKYSSLDPNGIYRGSENTGELVIEGTFGYDWGSYLEGDKLYVNEYTSTDLGFLLCDLVRIDINTLEKETLLKDAILRGRCASGELVCLSGFIMPSSFPETNSILKLYGMSSREIASNSKSAIVNYIDPADGRILYSVRDDEANTDSFDEKYLNTSLEEVMS